MSNKESRPKRITVPVTLAEQELISKAAKASGMSVSAYVRRAIARRERVPTAEIRELARQVGQLAREVNRLTVLNFQGCPDGRLEAIHAELVAINRYLLGRGEEFEFGQSDSQ